MLRESVYEHCIAHVSEPPLKCRTGDFKSQLWSWWHHCNSEKSATSSKSHEVAITDLALTTWEIPRSVGRSELQWGFVRGVFPAEKAFRSVLFGNCWSGLAYIDAFRKWFTSKRWYTICVIVTDKLGPHLCKGIRVRGCTWCMYLQILTALSDINGSSMYKNDRL